MFNPQSAVRGSLTGAALLASLIANVTPAPAQTRINATIVSNHDGDGRDYEAIVPVVQGWYKGHISLYLSTDSSYRPVSRLTHTNYVPKLANAVAAGAVDDIYQLTNFKQGNILPSSPLPAGPENRDLNYTPLWQLSLVTWVSGSPHTLKSEEDVLAEKAAGHVTVQKTSIVINCPVIFTPSGGLLYGVRILH